MAGGEGGRGVVGGGTGPLKMKTEERESEGERGG